MADFCTFSERKDVLEKEIDIVELDRVANLLGKPPGWMLHWGNTLILVLLLLLVGLSLLVKYPDEVEASVQLTTEPAPLRQYLTQAGTIEELLLPAAGQVSEDQLLLVLESTADWRDVQKLAQFLDTLSQLQSPVDVLGLAWEEQLEVGSLRPGYARLLNHLSELQYWLARSQEGERAASLQRQLSQNSMVATQLELQERTTRAEYELEWRNFLRFDTLLQQGAASQLETDQAKAEALQAKFRWEQQQSRQLDNELSRERLELEKLSLAEQLSDEVTAQWLGFRREMRSLQYEYFAWRDTYLVRAKGKGKMSILSEIKQGQQLAAGTPLWGIVPDEELKWLAVGQITDNALGKIEKGDTALIRLPAYPYREFGQLSARVTDISLLPRGAEGPPLYRLVLELPEGLRTSYNRQLDARQQLSGQARIISRKRSLLVRIFDRLRQAGEG